VSLHPCLFAGALLTVAFLAKPPHRSRPLAGIFGIGEGIILLPVQRGSFVAYTVFNFQRASAPEMPGTVFFN
jgi:hypothetical protein